MSQGFMLNISQAGGRTVATWVEGAPQKSVWVGIKLGKRRKLEIQTWRCGRCGYLESYARD
jgi:hypothetical protein